MLTQLKNFQADRSDLDEIVELAAFGRTLIAEYEGMLLPIPEWLTDNLAAVKKEALSRRRDALEKALKSAKVRKETLKTVDEKRKDLDSEIERLEAQLA